MKPIRSLISVGVALALVMGSAVAANALVIYVRVVADNNRSVPIDAEPSDTVENIKQKVSDVENIAPSRQILTYAGRTLLNSETLSSLNISNQAIFNLTVSSCTLDGAGTQADPWKIGTATDLTKVGLVGPAECISNYSRDTYYKLTANIALTGNFTPVELYVNPGNTASFDGDGKTISGLKVIDGTATPGGSSSTKKIYAGLFSNTRSAIIQNLKLTGESVEGDSFVGGLVGFAQSTTISNVSVTLTGNVAGDTSVGINHGQMVGGLVGQMSSGSSISNSTFKSTGGAVIGSVYIGGAIGDLTDSTATQISVSSNVTSGNISGGVIGSVAPNSNLVMDQMFYSGSFTGDQYVGGIIGYLWSSGNHSLNLTNSGVRGTVSTAGNYSPSAFVGHVGAGISSAGVSNSYSTAQYKKTTSTSLATQNTIPAIESTGTILSPDNLFESWGAGTSITGATLVADAVIDELSDVPTSWSVVRQDASLGAIGSAKWVMDVSGSRLNGGRPMPAAAYSAGFFTERASTGGGSSVLVAKPVLSKSPTLIGRVEVGKRISVDAGTWSSTAPIQFSYSWYRCSHPVSAAANLALESDCVAVNKATETEFSVADADTKKFLTALVTASNPGGSATFVASSVNSKSLKYLALAAPVTLRGNAKLGQALSVSSLKWIAAAPTKISYQWYRCDSARVSGSTVGGACKAISGATKSSYRQSVADKSKYVSVKISAVLGSSKLFVVAGSSKKSS